MRIQVSHISNERAKAIDFADIWLRAICLQLLSEPTHTDVYKYR